MNRLISVSILLAVGGLVLLGCGGGDVPSTSESAHANPPHSPRHSARRAELTHADARRLKAIALRDANVRRITAGRHVEIASVIPWVNEGGEKLNGAEIKIDVHPPLRLANERLPAYIAPNQKAPPGTSTLYRFARVSASNVTVLATLVSIERKRVMSIDPEGKGVKVTKLALIGPPPKNPAYRPEPGY